MAVPILTIPEGAFDPSAYTSSPHSYNRRKSRIIQYLLKLTHGSATALIIAYVIGLFVLKPLMELMASRRLEILEKSRGKLRDLYLNIIGRVNYIPIVAISKNDGSGKLYADAVCQTDDSKEDESGSLGMDEVLQKLRKLGASLKECQSYQVSEMPHYKVVDFALKDLQQKTDMTFFNQRELFSGKVTTGTKTRQRNLAQEVRNEIRGIKGMYMSGQA